MRPAGLAPIFTSKNTFGFELLANVRRNALNVVVAARCIWFNQSF
jgi:hypothetical protein